MGTKEQDIENLCRAKRDFFIKHLRPSMNEWILEDYGAWYCHLNRWYYSQMKAGLITEEDYQTLLSIAIEYMIDLEGQIRDFEASCNLRSSS